MIASTIPPVIPTIPPVIVKQIIVIVECQDLSTNRKTLSY